MKAKEINLLPCLLITGKEEELFRVVGTTNKKKKKEKLKEETCSHHLADRLIYAQVVISDRARIFFGHPLSREPCHSILFSLYVFRAFHS